MTNLLFDDDDGHKPKLPLLLTRDRPTLTPVPKPGWWARLKRFLKGGKENEHSKNA